VWWFNIFWLPLYLNTQWGFNIEDIAIALPLIYIIAVVIGVIAGWIHGFLMRRGWSANKTRKTTLFICFALPKDWQLWCAGW